jgi:hypothetical protein
MQSFFIIRKKSRSRGKRLFLDRGQFCIIAVNDFEWSRGFLLRLLIHEEILELTKYSVG